MFFFNTRPSTRCRWRMYKCVNTSEANRKTQAGQGDLSCVNCKGHLCEDENSPELHVPSSMYLLYRVLYTHGTKASHPHIHVKCIEYAYGHIAKDPTGACSIICSLGEIHQNPLDYQYSSPIVELSSFQPCPLFLTPLSYPPLSCNLMSSPQ